ncbi:MAG: site-specific integrase [Rhodobiaceae bacterium]|nr:site-specific integrase [Rhodobiaceae bacterium]MCC0055010.1 site-specific integrase [Rhodobiaceae bacterium]
MNDAGSLLRKSERGVFSLYARSGERKYINAAERRLFVEAANQSDVVTRAFCLTLLYTGCRLSEALKLTTDGVQGDVSVIAIHSLKKRQRHLIREVPVPKFVVEAIQHASASGSMALQHDHRIWQWKRTWAWMRVKAVMADAGIVGIHATPKGLRHGFGVHAIHTGVPLNLVQKWLGHAQMSTTAIYTNAVGPEERAIAQRMW